VDLVELTGNILLTSSAHLRMNFFAESLQIAGTVSTHRISRLVILNPWRVSRSIKWSLRALIDCLKTSLAGHGFPEISGIGVSSLRSCRQNYVREYTLFGFHLFEKYERQVSLIIVLWSMSDQLPL
jgi:hypothetical protein